MVEVWEGMKMIIMAIEVAAIIILAPYAIGIVLMGPAALLAALLVWFTWKGGR